MAGDAWIVVRIEHIPHGTIGFWVARSDRYFLVGSGLSLGNPLNYEKNCLSK